MKTVTAWLRANGELHPHDAVVKGPPVIGAKGSFIPVQIVATKRLMKLRPVMVEKK